MNCSCCDTIDAHFGEELAREDLERYRSKGPDTTTSAILDLLRSTGAANEEATLLDIGSGIGIIPIELLGDRLKRATLVDASSSYLSAAEESAERSGLRNRIELVHGDFTELSEHLPEADLVTLDRVVCCYPDYKRLLVRSASKAKRWYALSYPRGRWYIRLGIALENLIRRLRRNPFRTYVHDPDAIHALLVDAGLERQRQELSFIWRTDLYRRIDGGGDTHDWGRSG